MITERMEKVKAFLEKKLENTWLVMSNGEQVLTLRAKKRGNEEYNKWLKKRMLEVRRKIEGNILTGQNETNAFLITLTYSDEKEAWKKSKLDFRAWIDKVRKSLGVEYYFWVREAQKRGQVHFHIILILKDKYKIRSGKKGRKMIVEKEDWKKIKEAVKWEFGFFDVKPANREIFSYLKKYVSKNLKGIEDIMEKDDLSESEEKLLLTYYHAIKEKVRLWGEAKKRDLISTKNNAEKKWVLLMISGREEDIKNFLDFFFFLVYHYNCNENETLSSG